MVNLLIDTCVWLDVAKDQQQQATLGVLEQLVQQGAVTLIVPTIVRDEFARNKDRIVKESQRSVSTTLKRAKEIVHQLGDPKRKKAVVAVLAHLNEVDYKLPSLGESIAASIGRVENLFAASPVVEISEAAKVRAAEAVCGRRHKKRPARCRRQAPQDVCLSGRDMEDPEELQALPSWKVHTLTGNRKGTWSLSVTANRRLTFRIDTGEREIYDVNLEDYH